MSKALRKVIDQLSDADLLSVATIRRLLDAAPDDGPEEVTTTWCSQALGRSREWWAEQCHQGLIDGAYQRGERGPWYLSQAAARQHIMRLRDGGKRKRVYGRGPLRGRKR